MKKRYIKKGLVIGIIFLFLFAGVIPSINASKENKKDLYSSKSLQGEFSGIFILIGFLKIFIKEQHPYEPDLWYILWNVTFFGIIIGIQDSDPSASPFVFENLPKNSQIITLGNDYTDSIFEIYTCKAFIIY